MGIGIGIGIGLRSGRRRRDPLTALLAQLSPGAAQLILHPLEYGSMFQDRAGTTPVTESGQLVGRVLDAGPGGYHAEAVSDAARGIFRDVGGFRYVEFNGINTDYRTENFASPKAGFQALAGLEVEALTGPSEARSVFALSINALNRAGIAIRASGLAAASQLHSNLRLNGGTLFQPVITSAFTVGEAFIATGIHSGTVLSVQKNAAAPVTTAADVGATEGVLSPLLLTAGFPMRFYGGIFRKGADLTADQLAYAQTWLADRTGVSL
jgi:hypothetical protein